MVGKSKRGEVAFRLFGRINPETRVIEAAGYGLVRFTVPMLGEYIRDRVLWHE